MHTGSRWEQQRREAISLLLIGILLGACAHDNASPPEAEVRQPIVYGKDDRQDLYQVEQPFLRLGRENAVALIPAESLEPGENASYVIRAPAYGSLQSLCPGERFGEQPAAASCSGVLVAPDVVATAGHCLGVLPDGSQDCSNVLYVRGYALAAPQTSVTVTEKDIFRCRTILARARSAAGCAVDVVLVRLDRTAVTTAPIELRPAPVQAEEPVVVIGFPAGLPVKVDRGARVVDAREGRSDSFTLSSDTFAVSSGSGVFDATGTLVGVFARGRLEYETDGPCQRVQVEPEYGAAGYEEAIKIGVVRELLAAVESGEAQEPAELVAAGQNCDLSASTTAGAGSAEAQPGSMPGASAPRAASGPPAAKEEGAGCTMRPTLRDEPCGLVSLGLMAVARAWSRRVRRRGRQARTERSALHGHF